MKFAGRPRPVGPPRSRRGALFRWAIVVSVVALLSVYLYVMFITFHADGSSSESHHEVRDGGEEVDFQDTDGVVDRKLASTMRNDPILNRKRKIILSTGHGKWNTGVWPAWGYGSDVTLNWAAAGVRVIKECRAQCEIVHEGGSGYDEADAVVMELTNHPKFGYGREQPIAWPEENRDNPRSWYASRIDGQPVQPKLPLTGLFYYEPAKNYPGYTLHDLSVVAHIDFSMTPDLESTMPVTLICPWGRSVADYVKPPPAKNPDHFIAYFNEHGIASQFETIINELFDVAGSQLHRYGPYRRDRQMPPEAGGDPYQLSRRIDFMSTYKFILITEAVIQQSYISPEWSHAILAGAVPIYIGAPDIALFAPGPRSYIDIRDFSSGAELWEFLQRFDNDQAYQQWFEWKQAARTAFMEDEGDRVYALGTGEGVNEPENLDMSLLDAEIRRWSRPVVENLADLDQGVIDEFHNTAAIAWRWFRVHLDRCVHYAECRLCEYVTSLT